MLHGGERIEQPRTDPLEDVPDQGGEVAAAFDDSEGEFPPEWVARHDPEVPADIGNDGADRAVADLGRDVPGRGQTGTTWVGRTGAFAFGRGSARLAAGWGVDGGRCGLLAREAPGQFGFKQGGTMQAAGDARQDPRDVDGAKVPRDVG